MKHARKLAGLLLALVMVFSLTVTAFAEGETGSITIKDADNVSVAGKTFNAYKILDVTSYTAGTGETAGTVVYTVPEAMKDFYKTRYSLNGTEGDFDAQVVEKINAEPDMFAFAKAALAAAKTANVSPATATAAEGADSVTIDNLPLGYYVVEDTGSEMPVSALMLDTTAPNVEMTLKADKPTVDKKIDGTADTDPDTTGDEEFNNVSVGDSVPYKVTTRVPDMTGYTKYYFILTDTLSKGLTFNNDITVKVGSTTLTKDTDYTVEKTENANGTTVKIIFKDFIKYKDNKNAAILVTYSATVNENAEIGVKGNPNKVKLTYSNNPNYDEQGDDDGNPDTPNSTTPVGETPDAVTRSFVTELKLIKVDPQGSRLTGAEFKIEGTRLNTVLVSKDVFTQSDDGTYWKLKDGSYTTDDPAAEGMDQTKYESTTVKYAKTTTTTPIVKADNVTYTGTVGADGVLVFSGMGAGTYTITEIKAPNGYNLLTDAISVEIRFTAPTTVDGDGTWSYTGTYVVNGTNTNQITVLNQAGTELPTTGGMGTTIFYVLGSVLVLGAAVLLITKKRMNNAEG